MAQATIPRSPSRPHRAMTKLLPIAVLLACPCAAQEFEVLRDPAREAADAFVADVVAYVDEELDDVAALRARFGEALAEAVDAAGVRAALDPMRGPGAVTLEFLQESQGEASTTFDYELLQDESAWVTRVTVGADDRIVGWFCQAGALPRTPSELLAGLAELPGEWSFALWGLDADGAFETRLEASSGDPVAPLGSIFKLYVLAELARQVAAGELDLEQTVAIDEELKSLPSGVLQDREAGTELTLRELAELMIRISDNTATDHLIRVVGRERIEQHLAEYRSSVPERNTPFLTTREMFLIKGCGGSVREAVFGAKRLRDVAPLWTDAATAQRRAWLEALRAEVSDVEPEPLRSRMLMNYGPATLDPAHAAIEWHARADDIVALLADAQRGELVDAETSRIFNELYAAGQRLYFRPGVAETGFKGGNETGILALSMRVTDGFGRSALVCLCRSRLSPLDRDPMTPALGIVASAVRLALEG